MTQSPQKTYLGLKYKIILEQEQPERKFALSHDWLNLYIMNPEETIILEYVHAPYDKPKPSELVELYGKYSNGAREVLVSSDSLDTPRFCQIKICHHSQTITKTYNNSGKTIRIEV